MSSNNMYRSYYQSGSAVKKEYEVEPSREYIRENRRVGKNKITSKKPQMNISVMVAIVSCFIMTMVITYRYNLISEKNLEVQGLRKELQSAESAVATAQIQVEQGTDFNKIEAYAKQQLGMQKPDKNQTIYVDTSKSTRSVEVNESTTIIDTVINAVKNLFSNIF